MREGREAGCDVLGGLEMLVAQARHQFKLMTNTNISSELMYAAGLSALTGNFSSSFRKRQLTKFRSRSITSSHPSITKLSPIRNRARNLHIVAH